MRKILRLEEALLLLFAVALAAVMAWTRSFRMASYWHPRFLQCIGALAILLAGRSWLRERDGRRALATLATVGRDFLPFFGVLLLYETLHDLTPLLRPDVVDGALVRIDRAVFGVDAAYWLGQRATPTLTRVMVYCYASYFVAPPLLGALVYWRGDRRLFRDLMVSGVMTSLIGYLGYLAVPAVGPYVYQAELFPTRLPGGGPETHLFIRAIDDLRGVARDCFPSLHTAHTTVVLAFAARFSRWAFLAYLPVAVGLYLSTVYLRMHYVVDVAAGFATAAAATWLGPRLDRWWSGDASRSSSSSTSSPSSCR